MLGQAVLAWRAAHEAERDVAAERERAAGRRRRLLAALGAGGALLAVMTGVSVYALVQRGKVRGGSRALRRRANWTAGRFRNCRLTRSSALSSPPRLRDSFPVRRPKML